MTLMTIVMGSRHNQDEQTGNWQGFAHNVSSTISIFIDKFVFSPNSKESAPVTTGIYAVTVAIIIHFCRVFRNGTSVGEYCTDDHPVFVGNFDPLNKSC